MDDHDIAAAIKAANDAHMGVIGIEYQISRLGVTPSNRRTVAVLRSGPAAMQNAGTITAFACSLVPIPSLQRLCRMIQWTLNIRLSESGRWLPTAESVDWNNNSHIMSANENIWMRIFTLGLRIAQPNQYVNKQQRYMKKVAFKWHEKFDCMNEMQSLSVPFCI